MRGKLARRSFLSRSSSLFLHGPSSGGQCRFVSLARGMPLRGFSRWLTRPFRFRMARVQCARCFMDDTKEGFEGESWMFEFRPGNGFLRKKPSFVVWKETSSSLVLNVFECYSSWTGLSVLFLTTKFRDKGDESWVSLVGTDLRNGVCSYFFVLDTFVNMILKVDEVLLLGSRFMNIY